MRRPLVYCESKYLPNYVSFTHEPSLSAKETDPEDKVEPTISYLQKLGPEYLKLIFEGSKWVLSVDKRRGFQVCTGTRNTKGYLLIKPDIHCRKS